jgi:transposase-like protein
MVDIFKVKSFFGLCVGIVNMASYRELQEMLAERGVNVDHTTIYRWVQRYAPDMEKYLRWYWRNPTDLHAWYMDETYKSEWQMGWHCCK